MTEMLPQVSSIVIFLFCVLISLELNKFCGAAFFTRDYIEACKSDESVKSCLKELYDKLENINEKIESSRKTFNKSAPQYLGFEGELIRLNDYLDKRAGIESIITHILREDCGGEVEFGWDEESCKDDVYHIPRFNGSLLELWRREIINILENDRLLLEPDERVLEAINLQHKLFIELNKQIEFRHEIKAGFWVDKRYAARNKAAEEMAKEMTSE